MTGHLPLDASDAWDAWAAGALVGLAVLVLPGRPRAYPPGAVLRQPADRDRGGGEVDPPLVLDLVAAVVSAGAPPSAAVRAVAAVLREHGGAGTAAAAALEAAASGGHGAGAGAGGGGGGDRGTGDGPGGARPRATTGATSGAREAEALAALQRCLWIAEQTGAPVAALLSSAAAELRRRRRRAGALAAARLGVRVVAPLGLCTLPAFGLLAVVPVLLSLGRGLLG